MNLCIYKYQINLGKEFTDIEMPEKAQVLCTKTQHGMVNIWIIIDKDETKMMTRRFGVVATGQDLGEEILRKKYLGTVMNADESVFHVFDVT